MGGTISLQMSTQCLNAIVLAATEVGGMGDDYFENKTRHTLPIADKPLIYHLIKVLDEDERINSKFIVIGEKIIDFEKIKPCEKTYESIFRNRIGDDIHLFGQDPLTKVGTFEAVKDFLEQHDNENIFPLLVIYGDTLVEKDFLSYIIDQYFNENYESKILWGLIKHREERGDVVVKSTDFDSRFTKISEENIINVYEYQVRKYGSYCRLHDTGIMVISKEAWNDIIKLITIIHRPSSLGMFSFTNILRQALIVKGTQMEGLRDLKIKLIGVVAREGSWYGENYPWGILNLNKIKILECVKNAKWDDKDIEFLGKRTLLVPEKVQITLSNGAKIKGPCILREGVEIHDYAIIENSYIGKDCLIDANAIIVGSTLEKNVKISCGAIINSCIIMENSNIYYNSTIVESIVGKDVTIGVGVRVPCQRLKTLGEKAVDRMVTYFSDIGVKKVKSFGAIIGDYSQIGSGTIIHPGRRIGKLSKINSNSQVVKNVPPKSTITQKYVYEGDI